MKLLKRNMDILISLGIIILLGIIFWQTILDTFMAGQRTVYKSYYKITKQIPQHYNSRIDVVYFNSPSLNAAPKEFRIYVPKAYDENIEQKFPVLFLLHGDPGNDLDWLANTNMQAKLDDLITKKQIKPLLVIFPDGNGPKIKTSLFVNAAKADQKMEDYIVKDTLGEVASRYRVIDDRKARAIGGNSSGGYAAVNISLRHNDLFSIAMSYGGFFDNWFNELKKTMGNDQQAIFDNSPMLYLPNKTINPDTYIYLSIGKSDIKSLVQNNKNFDALLTKQNIPHQLMLESGFHSWNAWNRSVEKSLIYMDQYLRH